MSYIRTKDGIYEPDGESFDGSYLLVKVKGGWNYLSKKEPILKQADTIEELCDEIVIKEYDEPTPCSSPIGKSKSWKAYQPIVKEVEAIYGSIWVDGNLIKVAKMNEKGELELL